MFLLRDAIRIKPGFVCNHVLGKIALWVSRCPAAEIRAWRCLSVSSIRTRLLYAFFSNLRRRIFLTFHLDICKRLERKEISYLLLYSHFLISAEVIADFLPFLRSVIDPNSLNLFTTSFRLLRAGKFFAWYPSLFKKSCLIAIHDPVIFHCWTTNFFSSNVNMTLQDKLDN